MNFLNGIFKNKRVALVVVTVIAGLVLAVIYAASRGEPSTQTGVDPSQVVDYERLDPNSGDIISDPPDKTPDIYGIPKDEPTFYGLGNLLDVGVTKFQVEDFKYALYEYKKSSKLDISIISVSKDVNVEPYDPNSGGVQTVTFSVVFNETGEKQKIVMDCFNLDSIRLFLYDPGGNKIIYKSGNVVNKQIPEPGEG